MLRLERWLVSQVPELYVFSQICIVTLMSAQLSLGSRSLFFARYGFRSQQCLPSDGPFIVAEDGIALNPKNTF